MKILSGQILVNTLRKNCDKISRRFWVSVPYLGNLNAVRSITGSTWIKNNIDVRLLTDTAEISNFNYESFSLFLSRGEIRNIRGLHAKIYIMDDTCLISSANLTNTAFTKRTEIGVLLNKIEAKKVLETFESWWEESALISKLKVAKQIKKSPESNEEKAGHKLVSRYKLPKDPGGLVAFIPKRYINYDNLLEAFSDFASLYTKVQHRWPKVLLFLEIDAFLNYLYHDDPNIPSNPYKSKNKSARKLNYHQKIDEIKKYIKDFNKNVDFESIQWRLDNHSIARKYLSKNKIDSLTKGKIEEVLDCLNSMNSYPFNKKKVLNLNSLYSLRKTLKYLLHGEDKINIRFTNSSDLHNFGQSSMFELMGLFYPDKYPLINNNSVAGLKFFGYDISL